MNFFKIIYMFAKKFTYSNNCQMLGLKILPLFLAPIFSTINVQGITKGNFFIDQMSLYKIKPTLKCVEFSLSNYEELGKEIKFLEPGSDNFYCMLCLFCNRHLIMIMLAACIQLVYILQIKF